MSAYAPGQNNPLYPGTQRLFWGNIPTYANQIATGAVVVVGTASSAFFLPPGGTDIGSQRNISVEINFPSDPGAFEIDVQVADTDVDAAYILNANSAFVINALGNGNFYARAELLLNARFVRLYLASLTNPVTILAKASR